MKAISEEQIVVHDTPDNMPKKASRKVEVKGHGKVVAKGDSARSSLHNDKHYAAIEHNGKKCYVIRRSLNELKTKADIDKIVDETVREKVRQAVEGKNYSNGITEKIYMNEEKKILIKKVRCYVPTVTNPLQIRHHRDQSSKEYKQQYHVVNEYNYCMAIYEGEVKGQKKRNFKIVNMLEASQFMNGKGTQIIPKTNSGLNLKYILRKGTQILMLENGEQIDNNSIEKLNYRLYYITKLKKDGRIAICHNAESRAMTDITKYMTANPFIISEPTRPLIQISLNKFDFLIEGYDFDLTPLGEIKFKK